MFLIVLTVGIILVLTQAMCAWEDGYLTQAQMRRHGVMNGYSFMEHGGMWADIFVISPLVAYLASHYHFAYTASYSWLILVIVLAIVIPANRAYNKIGLRFPVAHNHDGHITPAGWIHVLFAIVVMWFAGMFYFTPTNPPASIRDILGASGILTPFFFLGIVDFNHRWVFLKGAKIQLVVQVAILWLMTAIRIMPSDKSIGETVFMSATAFTCGAFTLIFPTWLIRINPASASISTLGTLDEYGAKLPMRIFLTVSSVIFGGLIGWCILYFLGKVG